MPQSNRMLLNALNIKYIINGDPINLPNLQKLQSAQYFYGKSYLYKNEECLPRAIIVSNAKYLITRKEIMNDMKAKPFNPAQFVYLEGSPKKNKAFNSVLDSRVIIQKYDYVNVEILASSSAPAFLLLSDVYYPGWKAFVDQNEVKIDRANLIFRAIEIPAGSHHVRFVYDPISLKIGAIISIMSIGLLAFVYIKRKK
jgi:hypothetical protein